MSFALVTHLQEKAYRVSRACEILGVSRSGYYAWRKRRASPRALREQIHVAAAFRASQATYGSRRISLALHAQGIAIGRHRARTLMRQAQLRPVWRRKFVVTTTAGVGQVVFENVLKRQFKVDQCNRAWVSDLTYIQTLQGWLYLAVVLDLYSRRVVGWATSPNLHTDVVRQALEMAIARRRPARGLLLHSDRGFQYTSSQYQAVLTRHGIQCSMSRKGNCWDNAVMERFFLSLKVERTWQQRYANRNDAHRDIQDYIENFYNTQRLHSSLGYLAPAAYEKGRSSRPPMQVSTKT